MIELLLRHAKLKDSIKIYHLRNHPKVRQSSHNTNMIKIEEHQRWFVNILLDDTKQILIAQEKDDFVGSVRLELVNNTCLISWSVSPDFQGRGIGKVMVAMAVKTVKIKIKAEIKNNNHASIKIAEYIGMKFVKKIENVFFYEK